MNHESNDLVEFDRSLSDLYTLMKAIIKAQEKHRLNLSSKRNPFLYKLEKYIRVYDRTEPEEHLYYFDKLYTLNRTAILRGPDRDGWLKNGNIVIHFGEESRPIKDAKIHLSVIYNTSCKIKKDTAELLKGFPNSDQSKELVYPKKYLLYLYRIFNEVCESEEDQSKISDYIYDLEKETGVNKGRKKRGGGDTLMDTATELMEQFGFKMPEGQSLPSGDQLSQQLKGVMSNPQISSTFGNIIKEVQGCDNVGDMLSKVVGSLGSAGMDTATVETLKDTVVNAAGNMSNPLYQGDNEGSGNNQTSNNQTSNNQTSNDQIENGYDFDDFLD